jgi:hypothetical protein
MNFSYSRIKVWVECPRKYKAIYIDKSVKRTDSPALARGRELHERLEAAVKTGTPPSNITLPPGLIETLHRGQAKAEIGFGIDENGQPVQDVKRSFLGGYLDAFLLVTQRAMVLDWKSGRFNPDPLQADVYSVLVRANTDAKHVEFVWVYVDASRTHSITPDDHAKDRVFGLIDQISSDTEYAPTPNPLCRFCPVTNCRYNKVRT